MVEIYIVIYRIYYVFLGDPLGQELRYRTLIGHLGRPDVGGTGRNLIIFSL